jgi:D-proline reductase (dithiol) PrdB
MGRSSPSPALGKILAAVREEFDPEFDFVSPGPIPWSVPPAPLPELRVALITTAALHLKEDDRFRVSEERFGDTSFRLVPHGAWANELDLAAPYVDRRYVARDAEVALPMRALERLHRERRVGRPAPRHASFCGGIVRPLPGLAESAGQLERTFREDGVGAAVLLPTCSLCIQTVCLLGRELESRGFATVALTMIPELSGIVGAPRSLAVRFPLGAPCGDPGHRELHRAVLLEALEMLADCREAGEIRPSKQAWRRDAK